MPTNSKFKHLTFEDRCTIHELLNAGSSFTVIGEALDKDRTTVAKEVKTHRYVQKSTNKFETECPKLEKPPYVCNGCPKKHTCTRTQYFYNAEVAHAEYKDTLSKERSDIRVPKAKIAEINETVSPLMIHKHHSINHIYTAHAELMDISKSTMYRLIDRGYLDVRNIDLPRRVRFKAKKRRRREEIVGVAIERKFHRFYKDFQAYIEYTPNASIVEMDTVIGTKGGNGGKCLLTLLFRQFRLMLIFLLPYKKSQCVTDVFDMLKKELGESEFARLFEVILTDNGVEFMDPDSIERSLISEDKLSHVFYCDPNASWQKGSLEKNHEYIRYVLPKGTSFAPLDQSDAELLASHINSIPRDSLNKQTPYSAALGFIGKNNLDILKICSIPNDEVNYSPNLLRHKFKKN